MAWTLADAQQLINFAHWQNNTAMQYAVLAWMNHESGSLASSNNNGTNNPLNVKGDVGFPANSKGFTIYPTLSIGLQQTANRLTSSSYYGVINAAGKNGNPSAFLTAIATSPWDNGFWKDPKSGKLTSIPAGGYGLSYDPNTNSYTGANTLIAQYNTSIGATRASGGKGVNGLTAIQGPMDISPGAFLNQLTQTAVNTVTGTNPQTPNSNPMDQALGPIGDAINGVWSSITGAIGNAALVLIGGLLILLGVWALLKQQSVGQTASQAGSVLVEPTGALLGYAAGRQRRLSSPGFSFKDAPAAPEPSVPAEEAITEEAPPSPSATPPMADSNASRTSNITIIHRGTRQPDYSDFKRIDFITALQRVNKR